MSALTAGSTLCDGRYRLESVIGRGGMAIVWQATDLQLERAVAIKVISDVLASDPNFVARFDREARLAAALNHPNLVRVFDYSVDDERPFLVMELIAGGTLADARGRQLDVDALARGLLDAVAHIHGAGILHRDIKPANVLLDTDGAPRLTDFGIARGEETSSLTLTGQVLGTLRYIAPEVAAGEPATVQSDLYSLGVLLSELTGPSTESLSRLATRLQARDPSDRPRSATEALAELEPTALLEQTQAPASEDQTLALANRGQTPFAGETFTSEGGQTPGRWRGVFRPAVLVGAVAVAALLVVLAVASGGGGGSDQVDRAVRASRPAAAGAPVDQQIDRLEQIVRGLPQRD